MVRKCKYWRLLPAWAEICPWSVSRKGYYKHWQVTHGCAGAEPGLWVIHRPFGSITEGFLLRADIRLRGKKEEAMIGRKKNEYADTDGIGQDWQSQMTLLRNLGSNPSPQEADRGSSMSSRAIWVYSTFQATLDYRMRPYFKNQTFWKMGTKIRCSLVVQGLPSLYSEATAKATDRPWLV